MSMYKQFAADTDREKEGIIVDYGTYRVRVARAGGSNKAYSKALDQKTRPYRRVIAVGLMDPERSLDILREVYAEQVVRGWEVLVDAEGKLLGDRPLSEGVSWVPGIEGSAGEILPFTVENVEMVFRNLPDLFFDIREQADSLTLYRQSLRDELGKA